MKLFINGRFLTQPVSGVQRYAREIVQALDDALAQCVALRTQLGPVEVLVPHPVDLPAWKMIRLRVVRGGRGHLWEQRALYRASQAGVLVSLGNAGPLRHAAHVLCLHDANLYDIPHAFSARYRMAHRLLRPRLARRAAGLLTVSQFSARALSRHLDVPQDRFNVVPNSAEHMLKLPCDRSAPGRYGLTSGSYLLAVGNQSPNKNLARLIEAHQRCGNTMLPLALVGGTVPGVARATAEGMHVHMLGRVPDADLRGLYEGAAGFVFPSLYEGFGIPPLEAMQLGVPVLCARSGAMPEVLGDAPMWFDPRDVRDMAQMLQEFGQLDGAGRTALRVAGRAQAAAYSWRAAAGQLIEVIGRVMAMPRVKVSQAPAHETILGSS